MSEKTTCELCFFWQRMVHPFDFEIGRCELFEREMNAHSLCGMFEARAVQSNVVNIADHVVDANKA
jgi:hypothetical protein